jgi:ArsR family transcriptional regulator
MTMNMPISKAELKKMQSSADDACKLMKVLSNRDRMMLLCEIGQAEKCVGELEAALDLHQPKHDACQTMRAHHLFQAQYQE